VALVIAAMLAMPRLPAVMPSPLALWLSASSACGNGGRDVGDRIGDELLMDAEKLYGGSAVHYSCRPSDARRGRPNARNARQNEDGSGWIRIIERRHHAAFQAARCRRASCRRPARRRNDPKIAQENFSLDALFEALMPQILWRCLK
jgi:hypothetical protein